MNKNMKQWRHEKLFEHIKDNFDKGIKILELGPGDGTMLFNLHNNGYKNINFVDKENSINHEVIKNLNISKIANLDKDDVPFPSNSFDLIIALQILEHLENPWNFKRECERLLKPGGKLIFSMPYGHNLASKIRFFLRGNIMRYEIDNEHITFLTKNVFKKIFMPDFILEKIDYSRPTLNQLGISKKSKLNTILPDNKFFKKYFGTNVYYFLKKK